MGVSRRLAFLLSLYASIGCCAPDGKSFGSCPSSASVDPKDVGVDPCFDTEVDEALEDPAPVSDSGELVLVTGASGFIGSTLCEQLLSLGYRVRAFDNLETGNIRNLDVWHPRLEFVFGDIRKIEELRAAMIGVTSVVHFAAASKVLPSLKDPHMATFNYEQNAIGTAVLLEAANETRLVKKVIYAASSTYYGNQRVPFSETDAFVPSSPYAASKYMGELQMLTADTIYNLPTLSLRFFMVYGPRNPSTGAYAIVTGKFVGRLLENKPLVIEGTGEQFRDFVHVSDVARAVILGLQSDVRGTVINIGSGTKYSVKEVADLVSPNQEFAPPRKNDLNGTLANTCRARRLLNFRTRMDFVENMRLLIARASQGDIFWAASKWTDADIVASLDTRLPGWAAATHDTQGAMIRDALRKDTSFLSSVLLQPSQ